MTQQTKTCQHRWTIAEAQGPMSLGICDLCHEEKFFSNYIDTYGFQAFNVDYLKQPPPMRAASPE